MNKHEALSKCVRKIDQWIDEKIRWENAHPEYQPFREDFDSQRFLHRLKEENQ